jgi:hypothetical protein
MPIDRFNLAEEKANSYKTADRRLAYQKIEGDWNRQCVTTKNSRKAATLLRKTALPKGVEEGSLSAPSLALKSAMSAWFGQHTDGRDLSALLRIESGGLTRRSTDAGRIEVFRIQEISSNTPNTPIWR